MTSPLDRIAELAAALAAAGLDELDLTGPDGHVRLRRAGTGRFAPLLDAGTPPAPDPAPPATDTIASPGVGHLVHAHPLHAEPLVQPDEAVTAGQTVALLRVGTLLLPVTAPRDGVVAEILAVDGTLVGYGDPLLSLRRDS